MPQDNLELLLEQGKYEQVYRMYSSLYDVEIISIEEARLIYLALLNLGKVEDAEKLLSNMLEKNLKDRVYLLYLISHLSIFKSDFPSALNYIKKIKSLDSEFIPAYYLEFTIGLIENKLTDLVTIELLEKYPTDKFLKLFYCLSFENQKDDNFLIQHSLLKTLDSNFANIVISKDLDLFLELLVKELHS